MKSLLRYFLVCALLVALSIPAFADVIVPPQDRFFESHAEECDFIDRTYLAAGADGTTSVYQSPENHSVVKSIPNGDEMYVSFAWGDWFYAEDGWVHRDDVVVQPDNTLFLESHQVEEYVDDGFSIPQALMYVYPNGGTYYTLEENPNYSTFGQAIATTYTDEDGRLWGRINYYMQWEGWICLTDPTNETLDSGVIPISQSVSQLRGSNAISNAPPYLWIATGLVVAVVIVTLLLLRRKKS